MCFDLGGGPHGACRNVILDPPVHLAFWDIEAARLQGAAHAETRPLMRQRLALELDGARACISEMEAACRQHPGRLMRRFSRNGSACSNVSPTRATPRAPPPSTDHCWSPRRNALHG